jgi:hypothetical protein
MNKAAPAIHAEPSSSSHGSAKCVSSGAAAEQPRDQPPRFAAEIVGALDPRRIEKALAVGLGRQRLLGHQPREQCFDGGEAPSARLADLVGDFGRGQRRALPQRLHHRVLGLGDALGGLGGLGHANGPLSVYTRKRLRP